MAFGRVVLFLAAFLSLAAPVSAETITVSQKIVVHAQVLPAQYIVINKQGQIVEVISNSYEEVLPQVYQDSVVPQNAKPLSIDLYTQYKGLVPNVVPGILYKFSPETRPKAVIASLNLAKI